MKFTDKAERNREAILTNSIHTKVQSSDVVQNIIHILWYIRIRLHFRFYSIDHSSHSSLNLTRGGSILPQVHEKEEITIWQKLCYTIEFSKKSRRVACLFDNLSIQGKAVIRWEFISTLWVQNPYLQVDKTTV